jgi:hypothetical protein
MRGWLHSGARPCRYVILINEDLHGTWQGWSYGVEELHFMYGVVWVNREYAWRCLLNGFYLPDIGEL